ncbi:MAG: cyclic nucleotide-binding domain-containing protein [Actinomycetota bacterium]
MGQSLPEMMLRGARRGLGGRQPEQRIRRTRRETAQALSVVPLFAGFTKGDLNRLAEEADVVSFPAGTTIVEEGLLGETMFVVLSGEARVVKGKRRLGTVRPGGFFGEVALLDGAPRSASVVAETPVVAIRLFRRTLVRMLEAEPQLALKILDALVRRVRDLTRSLDA